MDNSVKPDETRTWVKPEPTTPRPIPFVSSGPLHGLTRDELETVVAWGSMVEEEWGLEDAEQLLLDRLTEIRDRSPQSPDRERAAAIREAAEKPMRRDGVLKAAKKVVNARRQAAEFSPGDKAQPYLAGQVEVGLIELGAALDLESNT